MPLLGTILKNVAPHVINGVKKAIGRDTAIVEKVLGERDKPQQVDANSDGHIDDNEFKLAQLKATEKKEKLIAYSAWAAVIIALEIFVPEINENLLVLAERILSLIGF